MIWIEIHGLPLYDWGSNAYKKLADMFGKFMFFEAEESTEMSSGRICISTKSYNFVSERVLVEVHGVNYDVHVHELGTWNINIVDETLDSSNNLNVNGMEKDADNFNSFIDNSSLIYLSLSGRLFTWMNKAETKLSKLNRFLISEEVVEALPDVRVTAIDRLWSDHNPILLHVSKSDFGPTPFKLFHSWLLRDSFDKSTEEKIKAVFANDDDRDSRIKLLQEVDRLNTFESFDLFQKKRVWISDPSQSKEEFLNFFKEKFNNHDSNVDFPPFANSSGLCALDRDSLVTHVSLDEVKNAGLHNALSIVVFYLAPGLKINIQKSNVYGIGVLDVDVSSMASNSGCASGSFPFTYRGLPIGSNMSLTSSWQVLLDRFQSKLSSWKANLLSIGGRHALINVVLGSLVLKLLISPLSKSGVGGCYRTRTRYGLKLSKLYMARKVALITMVASIIVHGVE
ncbi:RNA-directed DNA polymerase, eukaryota, reverse transcriptase zinc-binding domain protein [Tanacetum coccineum]|uniref:RNA-directed DNA polymerase, eukaryota, reverse transcriptase zinc-binding domain protein n=1 Tax=Tanacetum coccineum TaxID=301880 RepID=A0ABQ5BSS3_9ASTR